MLNEFGHVLVTSIVPSDSRDHFANAFQRIWLCPGRDESKQGVKTKFIYTDDVRKRFVHM